MNFQKGQKTSFQKLEMFNQKFLIIQGRLVSFQSKTTIPIEIDAGDYVLNGLNVTMLFVGSKPTGLLLQLRNSSLTTRFCVSPRLRKE